MIIDVTGTILIPGNDGRDCPGNGLHPGIECCCDECDYYLCCIDTHDGKECAICSDCYCERTGKRENTTI